MLMPTAKLYFLTIQEDLTTDCSCILSTLLETMGKYYCFPLGFTDSSVGKEPTCNRGDPSSIPWSGRSAGEGIGYPLQYSLASFMVQLVKNLPAMQETWI